jgi:hypothetical protein
MLWDASVMKGYAIEAQDGRLDTVSDFLFEMPPGRYVGSSWIAGIGFRVAKSFCHRRY